MKKYAQFVILAGLVVGLASLPVFAAPAQQSSQQQGQQASGSQAAPAAQGQAAAAPAQQNPEEEKAYKSFYAIAHDQPQQTVNSGESFLKKYPNSRYAEAVYARLTTAYEELGDSAKMFDAGRNALKLNPDNVDVLSMMAYALPRRVNPNDLDSAQQLQEASQDANHALDLLSKMQKPANLTQEQFTTAINGESAFCHSGLGLVDYYQHNIPGMVTEYEQVVKLEANPDPTDEYLLGVAYLQDSRPADAVGVLQKCAADSGPMADRCKASLDQAKKMAASQPQLKQP
jgi:tetratricopeptide (TPR) repeat protein